MADYKNPELIKLYKQWSGLIKERAAARGTERAALDAIYTRAAPFIYTISNKDPGMNLAGLISKTEKIIDLRSDRMKAKEELQTLQPLSRDLRIELRDLEKRIKEKTDELLKLQTDIKARSWNIGHLQNKTSQKGAELAINGMTERRALLISELDSMNQDLKHVTASLKDAITFEGKQGAINGQPEIIAKLKQLVEAIEEAAMINDEYYQLRRSFGIHALGRWPHSCGPLDRFQIAPWVRDTRKFLGKEK